MSPRNSQVLTLAANRAATTWAPVLRLSHWVLFVLLATALLTTEHWEDVHLLAGFSITALLLSRVAWALFEPREERPGDRPTIGFDQQVNESWTRLRDGVIRSGGVAVIGAIGVALVACTAGMVFLTHSFTGLIAVEQMHEVLVYFTAGLVIVQVVAVFIASIEQSGSCGRSSDRQRRSTGQ